MEWEKYRWEKHPRYYEVLVHQDLWSNWVVTRIWGRRNTRLGRFKDEPCASYQEALERLRRINQRRLQRGYTPVLKESH
jgi:predicted DNA-binding WGR domain protein